MGIATSLAYEVVPFPLHVSQVFVAITVALEEFIEFGNIDAFVYNSWFHGAKVIRIS
jgi:hypothetical protein